MGRHADFPLRRGHQGAGVVIDDRLAAQVPQKRAHGRELARGGRPRLATLVELADETPDRVAIKRGGPKRAHLQPLGRCDVREKLREIALVRAHGMHRRVAIQPQELQKRFEMRGHRLGTISGGLGTV